MITRHERPMGRILRDDATQLQHILKKVAQLKQIKLELDQIVDEQVKDHFQVLNFRQGILYLACDDAHYGTLLRYQSPELLNALRTCNKPLPGLKLIKCQIVPN